MGCQPASRGGPCFHARAPNHHTCSICIDSPLILLQDDDDEGPKAKDIILGFLKITCARLCICDCCWLWIRSAEILSYLVFDPFTELFITLSTIVNIFCMALDHYDMDYDGM